MHKKNFSRFRYTPVFLAMILCGTCHAAPAGFWENYQAPNDTALTTTAETYDTGRNSNKCCRGKNGGCSSKRGERLFAGNKQ